MKIEETERYQKWIRKQDANTARRVNAKVSSRLGNMPPEVVHTPEMGHDIRTIPHDRGDGMHLHTLVIDKGGKDGATSVVFSFDGDRAVMLGGYEKRREKVHAEHNFNPEADAMAEYLAAKEKETAGVGEGKSWAERQTRASDVKVQR